MRGSRILELDVYGASFTLPLCAASIFSYCLFRRPDPKELEQDRWSISYFHQGGDSWFGLA
jgi:hypothetical protein